MKKLIVTCLLLSLVAGPNMALAASVGTSLIQDTSGGANPIVKAKWEANIDQYTDDATTLGAQFNPSGVKGVVKTISMCAVVTDPDGLADVLNVYADVFYPVNVGLGDSHVPLADQSGKGCGQLMQEDSLTKLSKTAGIELFCTNVRQSNNNLPTFNTGYTYDEICGETGELQKDTAAVYCGTKNLSYEDPSGSYNVWAVVQDRNGLQGKLENHFTYLPLTAFETDFTQIEYGNVRLNTHKIISGDKTWDALDQGLASVRNIGNTRLQMKILQDDMGLGKTDSTWNVKYDARVGSAASYVTYYPEVTKSLNNPLDLSELDEMDFSIDISKFPPTHTSETYTGTMTLTAVSVAHLANCPPTVGAKLSAYVAPTTCSITVDDNGGDSTRDTIQEGVNLATTGQTVCIKAGTYNEDVNVNKSITLAGDGPSLVTLTGVGTGEAGALVVTADNVTVKGFKVIGTGVSAIRISGARTGCAFSYNNAVAATGKNAFLTDGGQSNHTISNNVFEGNGSQLVYVNGNVSVLTPSTNVDFTSNTFGGTATGPLLGMEANGSSITLNKFSGTTGYTGVESWEGNNLVNQNNFNVVNQMDITNAVFAGRTQNVGTLNAENNWWGDTTPADNVTGLVDFTPFEAVAFPQN